MDFENRFDGATGSILFEHRGRLMLSGDARARWTHGIA
jgi:hypothetical protein